MRPSPAADPFAHCSSHPALTPGPALSRLVSRAEATVPRLQPEEFASPLQSGLRYGIMSHISAQPGFSPGSSQQVCYAMLLLRDAPIMWKMADLLTLKPSCPQAWVLGKALIHQVLSESVQDSKPCQSRPSENSAP